MQKGIIFALAACFIWGLIFVVPQFMEGFSAVEVALGRYLFYGIISTCILGRTLFQRSFNYPMSIWMQALVFSLISAIGYYTCVVLAMRYASPAICALILGISPVTIAYYGNWKEKECSFKELLLPSCMIVGGLVMINLPHIEMQNALSEYILGLIFSFLALASWTWYVVMNAHFLRANPKLPSSDWSTILGVATLFWVVVCSVCYGVFMGDNLDSEKYFTLSQPLVQFLIGCAVLGVLCSWLGSYLWNKASLFLPVSLAGQLTLFETIFGLLFVYLLEQRFPPMMEFLGMVVLFSAVVYSIRTPKYNLTERNIPT